MNYAFGITCKKSSPNSKSCRFSPILSSRIFIVFCFTFTSVIYFEFIFVKDVKSVFSFSACGYTVVPGPFVEKTIFAPLYCLCYLFNDQAIIYIYIYIFLGSLICSLNLSVLSPIPHCLDYYSFIVCLEVG